MTRQITLLKAHREFNFLLKELALGLELHALMKKITAQVEQYFPSAIVSIFSYHPSSNSLHLALPNKLPSFYTQAIEGEEIGPDVGSCGAAAHHKKSILIADIVHHPNWRQYLDVANRAQLKACWSIPILSSKKELLGTFAVYHQDVTEPESDEIEILNLASSIVSVAMEKQQLELQFKFAATHDDLTGLYNRTYFSQVASNVLAFGKRKQQVLAVMFVDLNKFKRINDNLGHKAGDNLLIKIANLLKKTVRESDLVIRFGGDEFLIILLCESPSEAEFVAQRIQTTIHTSCKSEIDQFGFGISIGVAHNQQSPNLDVAQLVSRADLAMYHAKKFSLGIFHYHNFPEHQT